MTMGRLHTADLRSRTATARLPGVLARTPTRKSLRNACPWPQPNDFAEHSGLFEIRMYPLETACVSKGTKTMSEKSFPNRLSWHV